MNEGEIYIERERERDGGSGVKRKRRKRKRNLFLRNPIPMKENRVKMKWHQSLEWREMGVEWEEEEKKKKNRNKSIE